jgi:hypothetical protein
LAADMKGEDLVCPDCGAGAKLIDTAQIYNGRSYGPAWACENFPACDCYVGCHKGTERPKGTLAGKLLRTMRMETHSYFDHLWKVKPQILSRSRAYKLVADALGMQVVHIGESDKETCVKIKNWASGIIRQAQTQGAPDGKQ